MNLEMICYSPELDRYEIAWRNAGHIFKDEEGEFHLRWMENDPKPFKTYKFYFIEEL